MDKFDNDKEVLFSKGEYAVALCVVRDPILEDDVLVYGVYNTTTKVREAEARRYNNAVTIATSLGKTADDVVEYPQPDLFN